MTILTYLNLINKKETAIDFSQNISKYWTCSNLSVKRGIQNLMFPDGLVIDIKNRQYLTSKVNGLFVAIAAFTRDSEVENKKLVLTKMPKSLIQYPEQDSNLLYYI